MSLRGKGEIKEKKANSSGNWETKPGQTHESKMIAKGKEKKNNREKKRNKRRRGRALGAPSILSFHPAGPARGNSVFGSA